MVTVELREEPDVWVVTLSGSVPTDELLQGLRTLRARPHAPATLPIVIDGRTVTDTHDAAEHMPEIADEIPVGPSPAEAILVIVASRDLDYGNARVFEARFASRLRRDVRVVRTWSEALRALGFTSEQLPDPLRST